MIFKKKRMDDKQLAIQLALQIANFKKLGIDTETTRVKLHKIINKILTI